MQRNKQRHRQMSKPDLKTPFDTGSSCALEDVVLKAGGQIHSADEGQVAFRWNGTPRAFVLLRSGRLSVRFRTPGRPVPMAECRATGGQDCMPVTAALLSGGDLSVAAVCLARTTWLTLPPAAFRKLIENDTEFRKGVFRQHAQRLPYFFLRVAGSAAGSLDQRIADWLLGHAVSGVVRTTHQKLAADLLTAREVVTRRLNALADRGWIVQGRGRIVLTGTAALSRLARGRSAWCCT